MALTNTLSALTREKFMPILVDNIFNSNALCLKLLKNADKLDGGEKIVTPIEYATNANTVLMLRGDDAVTANDGVNMYGDNGFHLEFKEVGAGEERDYNNLRTGVRGLGSDTSATEEFGDRNTNLLVRSRSNQGNNAVIFVDETAQDIGTITGTAHHSTSVAAVFGVDSNTANVSIASGGTRNY